MDKINAHSLDSCASLLSKIFQAEAQGESCQLEFFIVTKQMLMCIVYF